MSVLTPKEWHCDQCPATALVYSNDMIPVPPAGWVLVNVTYFVTAHATGEGAGKVKLGPTRKVDSITFCHNCKGALETLVYKKKEG